MSDQGSDQITQRFVPNVRHDFNRPLDYGILVKNGILVNSSEAPQVGDLLRLVDMDATAGYMLVRITEIDPRTLATQQGTLWRCYVEEVPGSYRGWEPWEQSDGEQSTRGTDGAA